MWVTVCSCQTFLKERTLDFPPNTGHIALFKYEKYNNAFPLLWKLFTYASEDLCFKLSFIQVVLPLLHSHQTVLWRKKKQQNKNKVCLGLYPVIDGHLNTPFQLVSALMLFICATTSKLVMDVCIMQQMQTNYKIQFLYSPLKISFWEIWKLELPRENNVFAVMCYKTGKR